MSHWSQLPGKYSSQVPAWDVRFQSGGTEQRIVPEDKEEERRDLTFPVSSLFFCGRRGSIRHNGFVTAALVRAEALNIQQGSRLVILLQLGFLSCRKPLTKVTNNLLVPLIKIKMESIDDSSAQQLTIICSSSNICS